MFRPRDRGLLDFLAAVVAVTAVYTGTPLGGIADRLVNRTLGLGRPQKPLVAWFQLAPDPARERKPGALIAELPLSKPEEQDAHLEKVAARVLDPDLARAFAAVASGGVVTMDDAGALWYDVRPLPHQAADRAALGLAARATGAAAGALENGLRDRLADAVDLLAAERDRLGGDEAALAAWAVGYDVVQRAVDRARLTGAAHPARLSGFRAHLLHADGDRAASFVDAVGALRVAYGMRWPLAGAYPLTSGFGLRTHPILGGRRNHDGVDLGAPKGTPVHAAADGVVTYAGFDGVNGLYVKVDHGYGLDTAYCHASRLAVHQGERVKAGQVLAYVGSTGRSTGPHLHYGVFVARTPVDPVVFRPPDLKLPFAPEEDAMGSPR